MKHTPKLIAYHLQYHDTTNTLESATRTTCTRTNKHTATKHHPCDVRPLTGIVVEEPSSGDERHDLEQGTAESLLQFISPRGYEQSHYPHCGYCHHRKIEAELGIAEEFEYLALEHRHIKHHEIDT